MPTPTMPKLVASIIAKTKRDASLRVPRRLSIGGLSLRDEKDLAGVGIFDFRAGRITFHVNFSGVWCVGTDDASGFTRHLRSNRIVLGLRRRYRSGRGKCLRRRTLL